MKNKYSLFLTAIFLILLLGCTSYPKNATPVISRSSSAVTITPVAIIQTPTFTPMPESTYWLKKPQSNAEIETTIRELIRTNANCELPCLLGVNPGVTPRKQIIEFINDLQLLYTNDISGYPETIKDSGRYDSYGSMGFTFTATSSKGKITDENGMVNEIELNLFIPSDANWQDWKLFRLPYILSKYGTPDQVDFKIDRMFDTPGTEKQYAYTMRLYYGDLNYLIVYTSKPLIFGEKISVCPLRQGEIMGVDVITGQSPIPMPIHNQKSLEEITNITKAQFAEMFSNGDWRTCLGLDKEPFHVDQ
jgi:hypothetical protein